jgi:shikimate dehydrogenase
MTVKAGIVGWPVTQSLSPVLHGYWLKQLGIDGEMLRVPAQPDEFRDVIARVRGEGFAGVNVTVPHKEAAFALADRVDAAAKVAGAANLLVFRAGAIVGKNTDSYGLAESLRENIGALGGAHAVLLGAGGAARGAVLALESLGAGVIHILNRDAGRAQTLAAQLGPHVNARLVPGGLADWRSVAGSAALLVNSTSAGMGDNAPLDLDLSALKQDAAVCDIVYKPLETPLLKDAAARGHKTIDGLGMLMHQAAPSFEAFFGQRPQVDAGLRAALESALFGPK